MEYVDLASIQYTLDNIWILPGNGNGTFGSAVAFPTAKRPRSGFTADLNHDGKLDLITANSDANNVSVLLNLCTATPPCMFEDPFDDGIVDPLKWTILKPSFTEAGDTMIGSSSQKKASVIATGFIGCGTNCTIDTFMQTAGGFRNKIWLLGWYLDKQNTIELLMKEENDKWILRQRVNGRIVAKTKAALTILPNVSYHVTLTYDGSSIQLNVDGANVANLIPTVAPTGTAGYQVKGTTGSFESVCIR